MVTHVFNWKWDETIKERECADGRKQREYITEEDAASSTFHLYLIFIMLTIDAHENHDVAIVDVLSTFLHASNDEDVSILLKGRLVELMVMVLSQIYWSYISKKSGGESILYLNVQKALCGLIKSALLFYKKSNMSLTLWVLSSSHMTREWLMHLLMDIKW